MKIIAINWKNWAEKDLITQICTSLPEKNITWFLPLTHLAYANEFKTNFNLGSQNTFIHHNKTITGEINKPLLDDVGVTSILVNHSERDLFFHEGKRLKKILESLNNTEFDLFICVGEAKKNTFNDMFSQLDIINEFLKSGLNCKIVIAYEPRWAIGTGFAATPSYVSRAIHEIKKYLVSASCVIYGGSVSSDNAYELLCICDGLLIGSASRELKQLKEIIECTKFF
jgi:triosephosphate isomerase